MTRIRQSCARTRRALAFWTVAVSFTAPSWTNAGTIGGTATVDGTPAVNAVAYLERTESVAGRPTVAQPNAPARVMDQKNLAFLPAVLPIVRGTTVEFTNSDDVQHNVFTPSAIAGKFNLGSYGPGATRTVTFTEPGDVLILCNIHMEMEAHILVLDDSYFSLVASDGRYLIRNVPAGTYALKIWQGRWLPFAETVDVPGSGDITVDVNAAKSR